MSADGCVIKVNVEFPDEHKSSLLEQLPLIDEALAAVSEAMPTEAVALMLTEQKMKQISTQLSFIMSGILSSCISTEHYQGTMLTCTFSVVQLD